MNAKTSPALSQDGEPLNFALRLELRAESGKKRKGERTRDRLKAAAARLLEKVGYRDLRVTDINEEAEVSNALFYVYFKNKQEITQEVLEEFLALLETPQSIGRKSPASTGEAIYLGNLEYSRSFMANPGLMHCLIQFGDEIPEFGQLWSDWNNRWVDRTIRSLMKRESVKLENAEQIRLAVSGLGLMVDGLLRQIFVEKDKTILKAARSLGASPEALALFVTRLWYRAMFCEELDWKPGRI